MKKIAAVLITGIGFWIYSPATGGLWNKDGFANYNDCGNVRAWVASIQPPTTTPPNPAQLIVSPSCYISESVAASSFDAQSKAPPRK